MKLIPTHTTPCTQEQVIQTVIQIHKAICSHKVMTKHKYNWWSLTSFHSSGLHVLNTGPLNLGTEQINSKPGLQTVHVPCNWNFSHGNTRKQVSTIKKIHHFICLNEIIVTPVVTNILALLHVTWTQKGLMSTVTQVEPTATLWQGIMEAATLSSHFLKQITVLQFIFKGFNKFL